MSQGNKLSYTNLNNNNSYYYYDSQGIRYKKVVNNEETEYYLNSTQILAENRINHGGMIYYIYDIDGIVGFVYNNNYYYYDKNILGDILYVRDTSRNIVASYTYDAYGNILSSSGTLASINPFRYRGYYYDTETGLYYLNARYYDPSTCRFVNADSVDYIGPDDNNGYNLYAYCSGDPINLNDPSGHFVLVSFLIGLGISALIGALVGAVSYIVSEVISYVFTDEWSWSWAQFVGNVLGGTIGGACSMIPGFGSIVVAGITGVLSTGIGMYLQNEWEGANYTIGQMVFTSVINGLISAAATAVFEAIPIERINRGRGSYEAVAKQINTKFINGTIKHIKFSTFSKILAYNMFGSSINIVYSGIVDAI